MLLTNPDANAEITNGLLTKAAEKARVAIGHGKECKLEHILLIKYDRHQKLKDMPHHFRSALANGVSAKNTKISHEDVTSTLMELASLRFTRFVKNFRRKLKKNEFKSTDDIENWMKQYLLDIGDVFRFADVIWEERFEYTPSSRFQRAAKQFAKSFHAEEARNRLMMTEISRYQLFLKKYGEVALDPKVINEGKKSASQKGNYYGKYFNKRNKNNSFNSFGRAPYYNKTNYGNFSGFPSNNNMNMMTAGGPMHFGNGNMSMGGMNANTRGNNTRGMNMGGNRRIAHRNNIQLPQGFCRAFHNTGRCTYMERGNCVMAHKCPARNCNGSGDHAAFCCPHYVSQFGVQS